MEILKDLFDVMFGVYTVKEVANLLFVNEETIRKWIRTGTLEAIKGNSKKEGYIILEYHVFNFLDKNPKYKKRYDKFKDDVEPSYYRVGEFIREYLYGVIPYFEYQYYIIDNFSISSILSLIKKNCLISAERRDVIMNVIKYGEYQFESQRV